MNLFSRFVAWTDRQYLRIRHPSAWRVETGGSFADFAGHKYCLLVTFRRSGEPVPTPVWFGMADGRIYAETGAWAAKLKRIRNNPRVQVAPCTVRGKPLGPAVEATARILSEAEAGKAETAIRSNYGLGRRLYNAPMKPMGVESSYIEIAPVPVVP